VAKDTGGVDGPELRALSPSALVDEQLARIQERLHVDTVAVLLVDRDGSQLVARMARGLEEEVHQGVRLPVGRGFAGRVAATRQPVILDKVGSETVVNSILWHRGIRSMLGVPLMVGGRLLGVMHVGTLSSRRFTDADVALLQHTASQIAAALSAQQTVAERSAARTLQESLLPTRLPDVDGLEFATRFAAAEDFGVGGDWYDVFPLPDRRIGIVIGDVAGSGLNAAVVMGRLRSALRAYALESKLPSEALERLGRKFAHFEPNEMATVLYLTIAPDLESFTVSSTGHPPPVIAVPGRKTFILECSPSPPSGARLPPRRVDVVCELVPGTTVGCYTDGLVERHHEGIDQGLERLRAAFCAGPPDAVSSAVMSELIGRDTLDDDTALLVFRRVP
jgi:sigma-B regulation protein RsbU (phosphoserine phosphatase)